MFSKYEIIDERFKLCTLCEYASNPTDIIMGTCNICGCAIDVVVRVPYHDCPKGKWVPESKR